MRSFPGISLRVVVLMIAACGAVLPAYAVKSIAQFPARPVRMIVPFAPGGGSDIIGRILAQGLTERWGQTVVVDNRPGAGSTVGNALAARAIAGRQLLRCR